MNSLLQLVNMTSRGVVLINFRSIHSYHKVFIGYLGHFKEEFENWYKSLEVIE